MGQRLLERWQEGRVSGPSTARRAPPSSQRAQHPLPGPGWYPLSAEARGSWPCHAPEQCAADRQVPPSCFRCSAPGEKTQPVMLQSLGDAGLPSPGLKWEQPPLARLPKTGARPSPRTASRSSEPLLTHLPAFAGLVEGLRKQLLPAWCAPLAHGLSLLLVAVAMGMSGWVGASFPPSVSVMWLLSSGSGFLASFLCWEPFKVRGVRGASLPASGFCGPL